MAQGVQASQQLQLVSLPSGAVQGSAWLTLCSVCRQQSEELHQVMKACSLPVRHHVYGDRSHAGFVTDWAGPQFASQVQLANTMILRLLALCLCVFPACVCVEERLQHTVSTSYQLPNLRVGSILYGHAITWQHQNLR